MPNDQTAAEFIVPDDIPSQHKNRNVYFYYGWEAHAAGHQYSQKSVPDWQWGWMERERMIREAIQEEIKNG